MKKNLKITYMPPTRVVEVSLPASKSLSNRALVINALSGGGGILHNTADCDDTNAMLRALAEEGDVVNIGAAGTAMRFLTAYFAQLEGRSVTLDGSERMRHRPIGVLVDALRQCGAHIEYVMQEGFPPLKIEGKRLEAPSAVRLKGDVSSQYVSALMMIAPMISGGLTIEVEGDMISRPYVEMTAAMMRNFGATVDVTDSHIRISGGGYRDVDYAVESDWSAASYWYEIKAVAPQVDIILKGLFADSLQGDSRVAEIYRRMGVTTSFTPIGVVLGYDESLRQKRLDIDLSGQPDLAQTIVVTACLLGMPFEVSGLKTLRIKETDRIAALCSQLRKLGYMVEAVGDEILRSDGKHIAIDETPRIETFDDHRMAMSFAPAAMVIPELMVLDSGVVSKSYPDYWNHLRNAGFVMCEE